MNFAAMLLSAPPMIKQEKKQVANPAMSSKSRQKRVTREYLDVMTGNRLTTSQIANKRGIGNGACLLKLRYLESLGLIKCVGEGKKEGAGNPPLIWEITNVTQQTTEKEN